MSDSKAALRAYTSGLLEQIQKQESDIVFLLQAWVDHDKENPGTMPDMGNNRFPERIWRRVIF